MEKKQKSMHIRMTHAQLTFISGVAGEVGLRTSVAARIMLKDWERLGQRGAAEAIQHLENSISPSDD